MSGHAAGANSLFGDTKERPHMISRRESLRLGIAASAAFPSSAYASTNHPSRLAFCQRYIQATRYRVEPEGIISGCIDPRRRSTGIRSIPGADIAYLGPALALPKMINDDENGYLNGALVLEAVSLTVGGLENLCRHTDRKAISDGANPKGIEGCLHCSLMRRFHKRYLLDREETEYLFEQINKLPTNSIVYEGTNHSVKGFITIEQQDYVEGRPAWGLAGMAKMDGAEEGFFVYHKTLGEHRLGKLAENLIKVSNGLGSRATKDTITRLLTKVWDWQSQETFHRKAYGLPQATLIFEPDGRFFVA